MAYKGSCKTLKNTHTYEPIFALVARDRLAPSIVRGWVYRTRDAGVSDAKIEGALAVANSMESWQRDHPENVKVPD